MTAKIAYLTIDDIPSAGMRLKVDALYQRGVPAILFCTGSRLERQVEDAIYAVEKGFVLGNHAYDHPYFSDLTLAQCFEQIERTDVVIESVYSRAGIRRPGKFFRFPYGDKGGLKYSEVLEPYQGEGAERKEAIQQFIRRLGYEPPCLEGITYAWYHSANLQMDVDWYWTYDVMEWTTFEKQPQYGIDSLEKVFGRMDENVPEGGRGLNYFGSEDIVLMHDHLQTEGMFIPIIDRLLSRGICFRLPDQMEHTL